LSNLELEIRLFLAPDNALLDVFNKSGAMVRIDDGLANDEVHVCPIPLRCGPLVYHSNARPIQSLYLRCWERHAVWLDQLDHYPGNQSPPERKTRARTCEGRHCRSWRRFVSLRLFHGRVDYDVE